MYWTIPSFSVWQKAVRGVKKQTAAKTNKLKLNLKKNLVILMISSQPIGLFWESPAAYGYTKRTYPLNLRVRPKYTLLNLISNKL